jgi:mannose-6-phosphate isomerase
MSLQRLEPVFTGRVWGVYDLRPWFDKHDLAEPIGEVWFSAELLLKFLYTRDRLSVQVHPDDEYARVRHNAQGKTEAWYILRAEPGARIGLGFTRILAPEEAREAARTGAIENLLAWREVHAGECYTVPARTVHALGAGLVAVEIQQNTDITYRLYDYGRPRELHLEDGFAVADLKPYTLAPQRAGTTRTIISETPYFRFEHIPSSGQSVTLEPCAQERLLVVLNGGEVWRIPPAANSVTVATYGSDLLLATAGV